MKIALRVLRFYLRRFCSLGEIMSSNEKYKMEWPHCINNSKIE